MSIVVGIDAQPKRLGVGIVDAETGKPVDSRTFPLDRKGGGWPWQQVASIFRGIDTMYERYGQVEAVGIEDSAQGAINRNTLRDHHHLQAYLMEHTLRQWPWLEGDGEMCLRWWSPAKPGPKTPADSNLWRAWGNVPAPYGKPEIAARAQELGFVTLNQDEADAAVIAHATWRYFCEGAE